MSTPLLPYADFTPTAIRCRIWDGQEMIAPSEYHAVTTEGVAAVMVGDTLNPYEEWIPLLSTGLRDADGVEVFEGDIVETVGRTTASPLRVESAGPGRGFLLRGKPSRFDEGMFLIDWLPGYRVVGNVYEGIRETA